MGKGDKTNTASKISYNIWHDCYKNIVKVKEKEVLVKWIQRERTYTELFEVL